LTRTGESSALDRFDPLGLPRDLEAAPRESPRTGSIGGVARFVDSDTTGQSAAAGSGALTDIAYDTLVHQAFRVQVFTSKAYGEARRTHRVAEEIFDQPVYTDYEVPYYKVRVGSFAERDKAEEYLQRVRAAGYREAWVVLVTTGVRETAPLYPDTTGGVPRSTDSTGTPGGPLEP